MEWFDKLFRRPPKNRKFAPTMDGFVPVYGQFGDSIYASETVQQALKCIVDEMKKLGDGAGLDIRTMHEDIFNSMHKI